MQQCWLTGTAAEVTPVGQIGDYRFEVGELTRDIAEDYEKLVQKLMDSPRLPGTVRRGTAMTLTGSWPITAPRSCSGRARRIRWSARARWGQTALRTYWPR